jgi:hypothetical protein
MATTASPIAEYEVTKSGTGEVPAIEPEGVAGQRLELPRQIASEPTFERVPVKVAIGLPQPPRPKQIKLGLLKDPQLHLRKPIPLELSTEESEVIVTWPEIAEFGQGENTAAALDDFGQILRELHQQLFSPEAQLGVDLQHIKQILAEYIEPRAR